MHNYLLQKYPKHINTCSLLDLEDFCFTFIRNEKYLPYLIESDYQNVIVLIPQSFKNIKLPDYWQFEFVDNVDFIFDQIRKKLE